MISKSVSNGIEILTAETDHLIFSIVPELGGKILSIFNKHLEKEFLWTNDKLSLQTNESGADYDSNFLGAIDELIPNDLTEKIGLIEYPDHGELWTTRLQYEVTGEKIRVFGKLPLSGLFYAKTIYADLNSPLLFVEYLVKNEANVQRNFLWKLHAALKIQPGDKLITPANLAQVVDPEYSRFKNKDEFKWPWIEDQDASIIPAANKTMDFFYLYDIPTGEMQLLSNNGEHVFSYRYDKTVFPYQWYFASYGGFLDHYTVILEPCTSMPMSVNEAMAEGQSAVLSPGESLNTTVQIYAGEKINNA